jgi:integrase
MDSAFNPRGAIEFPRQGQRFYRDTVVQGFALRVTPTCKSYIVEARVNGVMRRITLGKHGPLTPTTARQKARRVLATMAAGKDPVLEKLKARTAGVTLQEILEHYLSARNVRPNTRRHYWYIIKRCLGDWLDRPVVSITRDMVERRHRELRGTTRQGTTGEPQANAVMRILGILLNFAAANYEVDGQPIILVNPIKRLSQNHLWYREQRRQVVIPDHKMAAWYQAVQSLRNTTVRDYLLLLFLTGLRRNEAATLRWDDIDLESRVLTIRQELSKNHKEHRLPLSDFLTNLLAARYANKKDCPYVFPGRGGKHHIVESDYVIQKVVASASCKFTIHDIRRTFLTSAEKLGLPYVVLKKLANHSGRNDTTFGYIIVDVERLREPMQKITDHLLTLMGVVRIG